MKALLLVVRFFATAPPVPRPVGVLFLAIVGAGALLAIPAGSRASGVLPALLALQVFACASGVVEPARRGFYDLLLTRGAGRLALLCGHWLASAVPGWAAWSVIAGLDMVPPQPGAGAALSSGSVVALWLASTLPWVGTAALPRFSGAIAWVLVLVTAVANVPHDRTLLIEALASPGDRAWLPLAVVVYPFGILGRQLTWAQWEMVAPAVVISCAGAVAVAVWFHRADLPLGATQ